MRERVAAAVMAVLCATVVAGCSGTPAGAEEAVARLAALDIVTTVPPEGTLVAYAEDLGSDSSITARNAGVVAVYATSADLDAIAEHYLATFPEYDLGEECCTSADSMVLKGWSDDTYADVTINRGSPRYRGLSTPEPSFAASNADLYVVVDVAPRPDLNAGA
ncbi:hypothetical protein QQX09_13085 [Demequina sp. SYSU T00192]|uniref:Uncharacterized protein n=1 Tax=Demequina litoralis TaxID=3051660 RepID=A0ABT8GCL0_9MICO|nr:hypothetical protein [Demequina sp. SYSU T00192]MDN4476787.1 hypothetical protein [Demequina sp. SYSU T00192]